MGGIYNNLCDCNRKCFYYLWINFGKNIGEHLKQRQRIQRVECNQVITATERLAVELRNNKLELVTHPINISDSPMLGT